jgi:hypothetical protein
MIGWTMLSRLQRNRTCDGKLGVGSLRVLLRDKRRREPEARGSVEFSL